MTINAGLSSQGGQNSGQKELAFISNVKKNERPNQLAVNYIHPVHHNFNMVFSIMIGIKTAVEATFDLPNLQVTQSDYTNKSQFSVTPYKTSNEEHVKKCVFFDYAP